MTDRRLVDWMDGRQDRLRYKHPKSKLDGRMFSWL